MQLCSLTDFPAILVQTLTENIKQQTLDQKCDEIALIILVNIICDILRLS